MDSSQLQQDEFDDGFNDIFLQIPCDGLNKNKDNDSIWPTDHSFDDESIETYMLALSSQGAFMPFQDITNDTPTKNTLNTPEKPSADHDDGFGSYKIASKKKKIVAQQESILKFTKQFSTTKIAKSKVKPLKSVPLHNGGSLLCLPDPSPVSYVYRENADAAYVDKLNIRLKNAKIPVTLSTTFNFMTTHYIPDIHTTLGINKTVNFYRAIATNLWVIHPAWINSVLASKKPVKEIEYTLNLFERIAAPTSFMKPSISQRLFFGYKFVFLKTFPLQYYKFTVDDLKSIIVAANGTTEDYTSMDDRRVGTNLKGFQPNTYVLTNAIGTKQDLVDELYQERRWITLHPDYILESLWNNRIINQETFTFTTQLKIIAKSETYQRDAS